MTPRQAHDLVAQTLPYWKEKGITGQIAFFGGTFTGLSADEMKEYLESVSPFLKEKCFDGIRISTRPDCVDEDILSLLKEYHVTHIELGVQSLDNDVLRASGRGYDAACVEKSVKLIQKHGFVLGMQMMLGLPDDSAEKCIKTARQIISLGAKETRIYPTLVLRGTPLAELYLQNKYKPFELQETVELTATLFDLFEKAGVTILKAGLHSGAVEKDIIAGPFHASFGQLVKSKRCLDIITEYCVSRNLYDVTLNVVPDKYDISDIVGQRKANLSALKEKFNISIIFSKKLLTNSEIGIIL